MTVDELITLLWALPAAQRRLPIMVQHPEYRHDLGIVAIVHTVRQDERPVADPARTVIRLVTGHG